MAIIIIILSVIIIAFLFIIFINLFINWASFIYGITPNKAIQLNIPDAIYTFRQEKIKISFPTFIILTILHWINKWRGKKKVNKEATNEFLRWLYKKGED